MGSPHLAHRYAIFLCSWDVEIDCNLIGQLTRWGESTQFLQSVHEHGLVAHGWTFKNEWDNLYWQNGQDPYSELEEFFELGLDGFFTDFPLTAR